MNHLVHLSGGKASAVTLFRVIERYGKENTHAVFADVNGESADLYRFIGDVQATAGVVATNLNSGKTCWDVWFEKMMWRAEKKAGGGCIASWELKKEPLKKFATERFKQDAFTIHIGFGPDEDDRITRVLQQQPEWTFDFPLRWEPKMWRCDLHDFLMSRGIKPSSTYENGYAHDNCQGACILAGINQWIALLFDNPGLYMENENNEQKFIAELKKRGRKVVTILRDRRGGKLKNLSLRQLRQEVESGTRQLSKNWRMSSCSCMGDVFA